MKLPTRSLYATLLLACLATSSLLGGPTEELLAQLKVQGQATDSDALLVWHDGKMLLEEYFQRPIGPIQAMSVTKSIVSLVVGLAWDDGKIHLEDPVHEFFPEWDQGFKAKITVAHLLTHTSGIEARPTTEAIYRAPDWVRLALAAELSEPPGEHFRYNNKATNLLPALVERATGDPFQVYLERRLLGPLGIRDYLWDRDSAGNCQGMSGFQVLPRDLLKLGRLLLDHGRWEDQQLLSQEWLEQSLAPSPRMDSCGLLWWRAPEIQGLTSSNAHRERLRGAGLVESLLAPLEGIQGRYFSDFDSFERAYRESGGDFPAYREAVLAAQVPLANLHLGRNWSYAARGYLGQTLVVHPAARMVALRMHRYREAQPEGVEFADFEGLVLRLARSTLPPP